MAYSQNSEEQLILDYFKDHVGTFADIGANDGKTLSNTRRLMELRWQGVCVEPSPKAFPLLKENVKHFKGVYAYNYAIVPARSPKEMTLNDSSSLLKTGDVALVSTLVPEEMDRFKSVLSYEPVTVKCKTWAVARNGWKHKQFDLLSLDIEGMDLKVLEEINLSTFKMVIVEWNGKDKDKFEGLCQGFRLIGQNGENLIFAR